MLTHLSSILQDPNSSLSINATNVDNKVAIIENNNLILEGNSKDEGKQEEFLKQYHDCFADSLPSELPPLRGSDDHRIDLVPGSAPTNRPPYRVSCAQQEEIMTQVNELVEKGLVRPSSSPSIHPFF